jgi:hypothetical protein
MMITHAALCSCNGACGGSDGCGRNCGVDGSSRRSCCSVGLYEPKVAVLAVRPRQSHGAMNAPAHIPFCALRAMASSATYALEYWMKAMPSPSRTSHALRSPSFVEQVASQKSGAILCVGSVGRARRSRNSKPRLCYRDRFDRSRERRRPGAELSRRRSQWCRHLLSLQFPSMSVRMPNRSMRWPSQLCLLERLFAPVFLAS